MHPQAIPDHIVNVKRPCPELMNYYVLKALATTVAAPLTLLLLFFRFHTMRYRFDAEGIHMRWGILMRHEIMLNYSRIQDIQLKSNVVERWLGLGIPKRRPRTPVTAGHGKVHFHSQPSGSLDDMGKVADGSFTQESRAGGRNSIRRSARSYIEKAEPTDSCVLVFLQLMIDIIAVHVPIQQ